MALRYKQEQERQGKMSRAAGAVLTVVLHAGLLACCFVTGFSYLDPPPPEKTPILIEFEEPEVRKQEILDTALKLFGAARDRRRKGRTRQKTSIWFRGPKHRWKAQKAMRPRKLQ